MKKLKVDLFFKVLGAFFLAFVLLLSGIYFLCKHFLLSLPLDTSYKVNELLNEYHLLWLEILVFVCILLLGVYLFVKKIHKDFNEDTQALHVYVHELSQSKNYEAPIKAQHYLEYLEIAVALKNITKRLVQKEKKEAKK